MTQDLNLRHLRALVEVARSGSFSAAAQQLNLTQPAVSMQVRELERQVGIRLLERVGRRAAPTAAGAELIEYARRIESLVGAALQEMTQHASGVVGRVRIGTGATACIYLLPPVLQELRRRFPALEITVQTGNTGDVLGLLETNAIDIALVTLPAAGRAFAVTPVLDDELVAVAAAAKHLPPTATAAALVREPLILYEAGGHTRRLLDEWFRSGGVRARPIMELASVEAIKEMVAAGLGIAVLPKVALVRRDRRLRLAARSLAPKLHRTLGVVLRRDKARSPAIRETLKALNRISRVVE